MPSIAKIKLLFNTVRYLKPIQLVYRVLYVLRKKIGLVPRIKISHKKTKKSVALVFEKSINNNTTFHKNNTFSFLNIEHKFSNEIDWDYLEYGRLWTYNLNYFEYLNQEIIAEEDALRLIDSYCESINKKTTGLEPFPLSLRIMNWVRFFISNNINSNKYNNILYAQLKLLCKNKEYHLLGNHLLENGFALLWGAYYFNDINIYKQAKHILHKELNEQILKDGAHFELSPMYHSLMLYRVLDCYNLITNNKLFEQEMKDFFKEKAILMLSFLNKITFKNGNIPLLNDAAFGIAPTPKQLFDYAKRLNIETKNLPLSESGLRSFKTDNYELIFDVGNILPNYQPGHAHGDTFSFELYINKKPIIVDTGTSTYEINKTRFYERSTPAHNTVSICKENSSQVWSGHRVAKRATVQILYHNEKEITASHNGFIHNYGVKHTRSIITNEKEIVIKDDIQEYKGEAYFHFAPSEQFVIDNETIESKYFTITFENSTAINTENTYYSPEFNLRVENKTVVVSFSGNLKTKITIL